jgi:hypothetical protein
MLKPGSCAGTEECRDDARCTGWYDECVLAGEWDCRQSELCLRRGLCAYDEVKERCVARSQADCSASQLCQKDKLCVFDPEEERCMKSTKRLDKGMFIGGLVAVGIGAAGAVAGLICLALGGIASAASGHESGW